MNSMHNKKNFKIRLSNGKSLKINNLEVEVKDTNDDTTTKCNCNDYYKIVVHNNKIIMKSKILLGKYDTHERALEILNRLCDSFESSDTEFVMPN